PLPAKLRQGVPSQRLVPVPTRARVAAESNGTLPVPALALPPAIQASVARAPPPRRADRAPAGPPRRSLPRQTGPLPRVRGCAVATPDARPHSAARAYVPAKP